MQGQLAAHDRGGIERPLRVQWCAHLATLRHFDSEVTSRPQNDPLIPCERRLVNMEISEFQELTFWHRFGNRDYDRPY